MPHIALLGDSIFDNAPYTSGGPAVIDHLRQALPAGWSADLLAIDGSVSRDVSDQLKNLSADHTHLVLSVGGNDALLRADVLTTPVRLSGEAFILLAQAVDDFAAAYEETIDEVLGLGLPLVVCTIYNGNFDPPEYQAAARIALCGFNDVILRVALRRSLPVIELRDVCTTSNDFANPIEPSVEGGAKIARAILSTLEPPNILTLANI
ncbi:MAG TPA: SGNH/GDSL hydrolase family protein [Thermoanaerobaculia bacterium]|nr:SGNH/GDSL hydrolase family protein [Thermoanaerobaculia bacterium]